MKKPQSYRSHILVIRLSALGDVAILRPVVMARAKANPNVLFTVAAPPLLSPLFEGMDNVHFLPVRKKQSPFLLYQQMSAVNPTIVADMHWVNRIIATDLLFRIHGVKVHHIIKDRKGRHQLTKQKNKKLEPLTPSWMLYDAVFDACGLKPCSPSLKTQSMQYWHSPSHSYSHRTIGIAPFAQHSGKIWPEEKTTKLIALLANNSNYEILLFGGRNEAKTLEQWASPYSNVHSTAGKQSFADELHLISSLDVMISMDSANMHFASCLGVPVVSIWGATHPAGGFEGWRQNPASSIQSNLPCRPCSMYGKKKCLFGDYRCLATITPEQVEQKTIEIIS